MDNRVFGCDICMDVCPWNRFARHHNETDFVPKSQMMEMTKSDWKLLAEQSFLNLFRGTPVMRTKYAGLKRNITFLDL